VTLAAGLYLPALRGGLVWDDVVVVSRQLAAFHSVRDVLVPPAGIHEWSTTYYRPLVTASYLLDRALFGTATPAGPHAAVILYHVLATLFVWMLARRLLAAEPHGEWGAVGAAAIFAAHPIHSESVCWITGRSDTVATMLVLPSLLLALHYRDHRSPLALILAPLLYLCALLAKEVAVSALLLLPLLFALVPRTAGPSSTRWWLPLAVLYGLATAVYAGLRTLAATDYGQPLPGAGADILGRMAAALAYYARKVVVPPPQSHFVGELPEGALVVATLAALVALVVLALRAAQRGWPIPLLACGWFMATLVPSLAVAGRDIADTAVAERYLYLPSVGFCVLAGWLLAVGLARRRWRVPATAATLALVAVYGFWTIGRCRIWQNDLALWTDATEKTPHLGLPWLNRGMVFMQMGDNEAAARDFDRALGARYTVLGRSMAHNNIGFARLNQGRLAEAEAAFRAALRERRHYESPHFGLGLVALRRADQAFARDGAWEPSLLAAAERSFLAALSVNPRDLRALSSLALCEIRLAAIHRAAGHAGGIRDRLARARTVLERIVRLDPQTMVGDRRATDVLATLDTDVGGLGP
jgi:tetratricopeptide (TPR) repeat protein